MILLIDNYDSFSYNLYQLVGSIDPDIEVIRNDAMTVEEIREKNPSCIILSPGPGRPENAGVCEEVVRDLGGKIPILGVCLGHQAICEAMGATVGYARELMHGKQSEVHLDTTSPVFSGLPEKVPVGRYHSLAVRSDSLPDTLREIAEAEDGEVMAVQSTEAAGPAPICGLQFHPESIMTPDGRQMIGNFLRICGE